MHIPDGFLNVTTWGGTWALSAAGLGFAAKRAAVSMKEKIVPMMGVTSAFIFAAQMLNFPVAGGTSGHLLGGVLAAVLLGPAAASIVLAVVLIVQALVFQDGGITALGANIFNMSFVGTLGGWLIFKLISKIFKKENLFAVAFAAWASVMLASFACAVELAFSGTVPFAIVAPAMLSVHALIGIGEALITVAVVAFVKKARPDLVAGFAKNEGEQI